MPELRDVLERTRDRYPEPAVDLGSVLRRHDRRQRQRRIAAGSVALTLVAVVLGGLLWALRQDRSVPAEPTPVPRGERIVFTTGGSLWNVMDPGSSDIEPLEDAIELPEGMSLAAVARSSRGAYAFVASIDPAEGTLDPADWDANLWLADADGGSVRRITSFTGADRVAGMPAWSPDGERIALLTYSDGRDSIALIGADDGALRSLDVGIDVGSLGPSPVWSPDGSRIAVEGVGEIGGRLTRGMYAVDVDDGAVGLLAAAPRPLGWSVAALSPDWTRIAFVQRQHTFVPRQDLYVMRVGGSAILRLTEDRRSTGTPVWSPDGSRIAFLARHENPKVYVIAADGSDRGRPSELTYGEVVAWWPAIDAPAKRA